MLEAKNGRLPLPWLFGMQLATEGPARVRAVHRAHQGMSVNPDAHVAPQVTTLLRFEVLGLCSAAWRKTEDTSMVQCARCTTCARCVGGTLAVCMSTCGPVYKVCIDQPKPIWVRNALNW